MLTVTRSKMDSDLHQSDHPLILFSGMGADAAVFAPQKVSFPNLVVPEWPVPDPNDDLSSYGARLAADIDPGCPCFVGGASFGGIIALEVARYLDVKACFLIGSVRGPQQLPLRIRALRPLRFGIGLVPIRLLQRSAASSVKSAAAISGPHVAAVMQQFTGAQPEVLRWSARQVLHWRATYDQIPTFHIHGDRDEIFPMRYTSPDEVIQGGGHVISLTHGAQVNDFLRKYIAEFSA